MFPDNRLNESYQLLARLSDPLKPAEREIVGREREQLQLMAAMSRPELCNALLLAEAGTGKTALVQATMVADPTRLYLEVDPARMISEAGDADRMAAMLKGFFDEAEQFVRVEEHDLVLFIDEFHQIIQLSDAAVEAIKPVLAASGARGIRVIAATTYDEFHKHISPNQPLVERLQRINVAPPDEATTVQILRGMAERYGVADQFYDDHMFKLIYDYTERYLPASSQPRKSILVLDSMVGWHTVTKRLMDRDLLADVLMESINVNIAFRVDALKIKEHLDAKVLSQHFATSVVARRLQLCVADLNDATKPLSSFLFTGSTGVGKATTCSTEIPVWSADGSVAWKKAGDLVPGDYCFTRRGTPQRILGVFPQGEREVYRVTLDDGRTLDVSDHHLWAVYPTSLGDVREGPTIYSTQMLLNQGLLSRRANGAVDMKYAISMNEPVQWPEQELPIHPHALGTTISAGCSQGQEQRIPAPYAIGSIEQRWELVRGLFDTEAPIGQADLSFSTTSAALAEDVQRLLFSLGVSSTFSTSLGANQRHADYTVRVKGDETSDFVGIRSIEELGHREPMVCIYVDDDEHLYLAGDFVVTHNTELTKQLAQLLFGDDQRHLIRFDMTEFADDSTFATFRSELTKKVWDRSHSVLLFDEIEKASPLVTRVLLQVLDDGRLSDDNNREVSFLNTYIVLTTNAGSEVYETIAQYEEDDTGSGKKLLQYEKLIRQSISTTAGNNRFPPELLGRIDAIVPFQPLSRETQRLIVRNKLRDMVNEVMTKHNVRVGIDRRVLQYLIEDKAETDSNAGGARQAVAKMTDEVTTAVAAFLNAHPTERHIRVDVTGNLVSDDKFLLMSDACVEVTAAR